MDKTNEETITIPKSTYNEMLEKIKRLEKYVDQKEPSQISSADEEAFNLFFKQYPPLKGGPPIEIRPWFRLGEGAYYFGECTKDKKGHGRGICLQGKGSRYEGYFQYGSKSGKGKFYYANGQTYEGDWLNNVMHGYGTYSFMNGDKYIGNWKNGMRDGDGLFEKIDGTKYKGEWKDNKKHGKGEEYDPKVGVWKKGIWKEGKLEKYVK